jgi:hypothetical protein
MGVNLCEPASNAKNGSRLRLAGADQTKNIARMPVACGRIVGVRASRGSMSPLAHRRFPPPWTVEKISGRFVVRDAIGNRLPMSIRVRMRIFTLAVAVNSSGSPSRALGGSAAIVVVGTLCCRTPISAPASYGPDLRSIPLLVSCQSQYEISCPHSGRESAMEDGPSR